MKKVILSTISLAVLVFGVGSCKKVTNSPNSSNNDNASLMNFKAIGEFHNAGLDFVFQRLVIAKDSKLMSIKEAEGIIKFIDQEALNFARNSNTFVRSDFHFNEAIYLEIYDKSTSVYKTMKQSKSTSLLWLPDEQLTENIKMYFEVIESIFDIDDFNYRQERLTETLNELYNSDLPEYDKFVLLTTYEVAIHSDNYWNHHWEEWRDLFEEYNEISPETAKKMAKADMSGAAVAAGAAWWANLVVGPGTVAYSAAIGGGALGASAYEGVNSFLNWLFP